MVKIGIVSDSHGREIQLERFADRCKQAKYDAVFHLGDMRDDAKWLEKNLDIPVISVAGNCDTFSRHQRTVCVRYEGHVVLAVHGHEQGVKYGYERLSYYAEDAGADIALFGHTHCQFCAFVGNVMMINPGALRNGDYAELEIDGKNVTPRERNLDDRKQDV